MKSGVDGSLLSIVMTDEKGLENHRTNTYILTTGRKQHVRYSKRTQHDEIIG